MFVWPGVERMDLFVMEETQVMSSSPFLQKTHHMPHTHHTHTIYTHTHTTHTHTLHTHTYSIAKHTRHFWMKMQHYESG